MTDGKVATPRPVDVPLNRIQAGRLSRLTGLPAAELVDRSLGQLEEQLRWRMNPEWFLFELVCGRVVKPDPATGSKYPVPGATVNALDVDCDWLWFFPPGWPWGWVFPWGFCHTETLATTTTDACGNFCLWIPRFDIDWVLGWRRERLCFPDLLRRPSIGDLLQRIQGEGLLGPPFHGPIPPDPAPLVGLLNGRPDIASAIGSGTAARLLAGAANRGVGADSAGLHGLLAGPAFAEPVPPPLDAELRRLHERGDHAALAERLDLEATRVEKLDLSRWQGPYLRCFDVFVPVWFPVFEVPDITIQVTQDTDGDGDQEVIYDHAFGVPWSIPTPNLELDAAPFALALPSPGCGPAIACADTPAIQTVGLMPVDPGFVETTHGFATRPNPSRTSGLQSGTPTYPSTAPFAGTIQLYGCAAVAGADHYRILAEYAPGDGLTGSPAFGAPQPLKEMWHVFRLGPPFVDQVQQPVDAAGWYPILDDTWLPEHLLMNWNPGAMGSYRLTLQVSQLAGGSFNLRATAPPIVLFVDGSAPTVTWNFLRWRYQGDVAWNALPLACPLVKRDRTRAVEVQVGITASSPHLRQVVVQAGGCGGASPSPTPVEHWHTSELDNSWSDATIYTIPALAAAGCYSWTVLASSRSFNPAGGDDGLARDWLYDPMLVWVSPSLSVAVVDA
jgi:hypothetical protein